jgi:hypothetical protein
MPQMPFDDAMKRILAAPPQHREAQEKRQSGNKKPAEAGFCRCLLYWLRAPVPRTT